MSDLSLSEVSHFSPNVRWRIVVAWLSGAAPCAPSGAYWRPPAVQHSSGAVLLAVVI